ncbi:tudor and KH domain-containing protein isoform X2 [Ascaphus truei]|uniref:tudor and KH domain-containing protein isoform X2 n=1 Tax=Ascaphus truei TaxID=8439 RepID=UPI003F59690F
MDSWKNLTTGQKVAATVGVSASAAVLYICYTKYRSEGASRTPAPPEEDVEIRVRIPQEAVKLLVGRGGAVRNRLRKQTGAHLAVTDVPDSDGGHQLTIRGSPMQVCQAQVAVREIMQNTVLRTELRVPSRCVSRVIGRGGDRIRAISKCSGANIQCEKKPGDADLPKTRLITVSGTKEQVEMAKSLIQKVSEEEEEHFQKKAADSSAFRCRRKEIIGVKKKPGNGAAADSTETPQVREAERGQTSPAGGDTPRGDGLPSRDGGTDGLGEVFRFEVPSPDFSFQADEYVDLYVSAVENPEHFWIQILGSRSQQLDQLTREMSEHYGKQRQLVAMPEIRVGDIVAAPFHMDKFWYRAEVLGFLENRNVDLYYVDYGDNWETSRDNLFPLRSDYLSLPFQAIECSLTGIAPAGGKWSNEALDEFDNLTHCAKWKPLLAKISSFPVPGVSRCFHVHLYDPSAKISTDIGQQLVRRSFAIESEEGPEQAEEGSESQLLEDVTSLSLDLDTSSFVSRQDERARLSDDSFDLLRSDMEPPGPSSEGTFNVDSTPACCQSEDKEQSLALGISSMKISLTVGSPAEDSSESQACSRESSVQSIDSSVQSIDSSTDSRDGQTSSLLQDSSTCSPRGCFYYLSSEDTSYSSVFDSSAINSSTREIITISSDSEEEEPVNARSEAPSVSGTTDDDDDDDDVILVENT